MKSLELLKDVTAGPSKAHRLPIPVPTELTGKSSVSSSSSLENVVECTVTSLTKVLPQVSVKVGSIFMSYTSN